MKKLLTKDEISFLLKGSGDQHEADEESRSFMFIEALAGLFPRKRMVLVVGLFCLAVVPLLGGHVLRRAYGEGIYLALWLLTALVGSYIIMRDAGPGLEALVKALRGGEAPEHLALQRLARGLSGLMLIMPGPLVNLLACVLLLPPVNRIAAIFMRRKLELYLEDKSAPN